MKTSFNAKLKYHFSTYLGRVISQIKIINSSNFEPDSVSPNREELKLGESCDVIRVVWVLRCSINNNENNGSGAEILPDLDELPVFSFDPDISYNDEDVGG